MKYIFPLSQHIGASSKPVVSQGDTVERGQLIAQKPSDKLGANIFSSVTGTVASVCSAQIIIDEKNTDFDHFVPLEETTPNKLIEEAGIVGLGGAGFPTYVKTNTDFKSDGCILVNAAECEPILSHNIARIEQEAEKLVAATRLVIKLTHAKRGIIAIKAIHTKAIACLAAALDDPCLSIHKLENVYPVGEERAIVRECLGTLLEPDMLPLAANAIVLNAETLYRIYEAVEHRKPLIDKDVTVAGKLKDNASTHVLFDVPLGAPVKSVIDSVGGLSEQYGELIMGGPFTGVRTTLDAPLIKTTGGIIVAENFLPGPKKMGLLVCACGANKERLTEQAASMGSEVVGIEYCKQAQEVKGVRKCENPGKCPGQVQKVMALKKAGAAGLLISNCTDCTNTVMSCAPQLKLPVYHCTDGALRAVNHKLIRKFTKE